MKTIWIKQFESYIVDAITFDANKDDYSPIEVEEMPFDVMCGCYQLIEGILVRDETKHIKQQHESSAQTKITNLTTELDRMLSGSEISKDIFDKIKSIL